MAGYMAKLGSFMFALDTAGFQDLDRRSTHDWQELKRIGRKPAQQSIGPGADTISLSGVIYPHFRGGLSQVGAMRSMQSAGIPLALVYGFETAGQYCGRWCIKDVSEKRTIFFPDGSPRKIEFSLELVEYGEDATAAPGQPLNATVVPVSGGAVTDAGSVLSASKAATDQAGAMSVAGRLGATFQTVSDSIGSAYKTFQTSGPGQLLRTVAANAGDTRATITSLSNAATAIKAAKGNPAAMFDALQGASAAAGSSANVLGGVASALGLDLGMVNGGSGTTLFSKELSTSIGDFRDLSNACGDLSGSADILQGVIGG